MTPENRAAFAKDGIVVIKELADGDVVGLYEYLTTTSLCVFTGDYAVAAKSMWNGQKRRFCYPYRGDALVAGIVWDGTGDPPGRWVKDKSPGQDRLNPAFGTALFDEV